MGFFGVFGVKFTQRFVEDFTEIRRGFHRDSQSFDFVEICEICGKKFSRKDSQRIKFVEICEICVYIKVVPLR